MIRSILQLATFCLIAVSANAEEDIVADRMFGDWSAFIDGDDCWVASHPAAPAGPPLEDVYFFVTFHNLFPAPSISIWPHRVVNEQAGLQVLTGRHEFAFQFADGIAFPELEDELPILRALLASKKLVIKLEDAAGNELLGHIVYNGFSDAYNYTSRACEFNFHDGLTTEDGTEPT